MKVYLLRARCLYLALDLFLLDFTLRFVFWFSFPFVFTQLPCLPHVCSIAKTKPPNTMDGQQSPPSQEHCLVLYSASQSPSSLRHIKMNIRCRFIITHQLCNFVITLMYMWPKPILAILLRLFVFIAPKTLNYMGFQSFDFERTWWRLFAN